MSSDRESNGAGLDFRREAKPTKSNTYFYKRCLMSPTAMK